MKTCTGILIDQQLGKFSALSEIPWMRAKTTISRASVRVKAHDAFQDAAKRRGTVRLEPHSINQLYM